MQTMEDFDKLVERSLFIIREAKAQYKNVAILWSTGKDSTAGLDLCRKAFFGKVPFPVIHMDTGYKFPEIYEFRDRLAKEWDLNLIVAKNKEALAAGMGPEKGRFECCTQLKTDMLKKVIDDYKFDAIIVSIRRDEHGIRAKERVVSPRDKEFKWDYKNQPAEMWDFFSSVSKEASHVRIHPILHWTELNVWEYVQKNNLPVNPLYFAKNGQRYRSLGCMPCTKPVQSDADTIDKIVEELRVTDVAERSGRSQDKEKAYMMQKLRSLGYM
jgi:sulfate adenylyltransferase subunit 2